MISKLHSVVTVGTKIAKPMKEFVMTAFISASNKADGCLINLKLYLLLSSITMKIPKQQNAELCEMLEQIAKQMGNNLPHTPGFPQHSSHH